MDHPWLQNLFSVAFGAFLGIFADPIKQKISRRTELKRAKHEVYDELAVYISDLKRLSNGVGGFASFERVTGTPPSLDVIDWYTNHRLDLLLELDSKKGIRTLHRDIKKDFEKAHHTRELSGKQTLLEKVLDGTYELDKVYLREAMARMSKES